MNVHSNDPKELHLSSEEEFLKAVIKAFCVNRGISEDDLYTVADTAEHLQAVDMILQQYVKDGKALVELLDELPNT